MGVYAEPFTTRELIPEVLSNQFCYTQFQNPQTLIDSDLLLLLLASTATAAATAGDDQAAVTASLKGLSSAEPTANAVMRRMRRRAWKYCWAIISIPTNSSAQNRQFSVLNMLRWLSSVVAM